MNMLGIERRVKIDFSWMLAGNVFYSACQWLIVVVIAKLGTPEQLGHYGLGLAMTAPVILFANLQLRSLLVSDVAERFSFGQYLTFRLVSVALALVFIAALAVVTVGAGNAAIVIALVGFAQAVELISETYYGFLQRREQMERISWSLMMRGPFALAAMGLTMHLTHSVVWAIAALAAGRLCVLLGWDMRIGHATREPRLAWKRSDIAILLRTALPLGVISMLGVLNGYIPRYFVQAHWGAAELGMFSAVTSLLSAGTLVVSASGQSMFLPVARACANSDRAQYRKYVCSAAGLGIALGLAGIVVSALFGTWILTRIFRPEYAQHADVLTRIMIAGTILFLNSGLGFVMTAARSLRPQVPLLIATGIASVAASAFLIPRYGLTGAADATLLAALVQLAGGALILAKIDRTLRTETAPTAVSPLYATNKC